MYSYNLHVKHASATTTQNKPTKLPLFGTPPVSKPVTSRSSSLSASRRDISLVSSVKFISNSQPTILETSGQPVLLRHLNCSHSRSIRAQAAQRGTSGSYFNAPLVTTSSAGAPDVPALRVTGPEATVSATSNQNSSKPSHTQGLSSFHSTGNPFTTPHNLDPGFSNSDNDIRRRVNISPEVALASQDELDSFRHELSQRMSDLAEHPVDEVSLRAKLVQQANDCETCGPQPLSRASSPSSSSGLQNPSGGWHDQPHHLSKDELWRRLRSEAKEAARTEPALASFLFSTVLSHSNFEKTMAFLLANKLGSPTMLSTQLLQLIQQCYEEDPDITDAARADLHSVRDRDPACSTFIQAVLNFKGFQAVQSYRVAHALWNKGRHALAIALQSRISEVFHVDIHPAARIGRGILIDHATGVVIGQTAIVGDNVSMLHRVTLGGSGRSRGVRHPCIGNGVLLGAGVSVLGPVSVGAGSKVGAGSVVVHDLPCFCVAVGVPARIVKRNMNSEPVKDMDQCFDFILDYVI